jgi:PAS domain S-box-containing protein
MTTVDSKSLIEIFKVLPTPTMVLLPDAPVFTIVEVNDAYLKLSNTQREDLIGQGFCDTFASNAHFRRIDWEHQLDKVVEDGLPNKTAVVRYDANKTPDAGPQIKYLVAANTPIMNAQNQVELIVRSITDVTEIIEISETQKIINASLKTNGRYLEETQRIARVGSWEVDLIKNAVTWSAVVRDIYEVDDNYPNDMKSALAFVKSEEGRVEFSRLIAEAVATGGLFDFEAQIITARGNERWIRTTGKSYQKNAVTVRIYGAIQDITEKKKSEQSLTDSRNELQSLVQSINGIVWKADAKTFEFFFVSDHVKSILGYTPEEWLSDPNFWYETIHPADRKFVLEYCKTQTNELKNHTLDYRMIRKDGGVIWIKDVVSVMIEDGKPMWLSGLMVDITETKRSEELSRLETSILELSSTNEAELHRNLTQYVNGIEGIFPTMLCSIHRVSDHRLQSWLAPSLPTEYLEAIENHKIGPSKGSCGTAAYLKERVIVADIANDSRWAEFRDLALAHELKACWSQPVISAEGEVMATFGIYYREPKLPDANELKVIDRCAAILKVILENRQKTMLLEESAFVMKQGQELAHFGNWQWDIENNLMHWSDELYNIYGLDKNLYKASPEVYINILHPDDKHRVQQLLDLLRKTRRDIVFEERIITPSGEVRHLKSWGRVTTDKSGNLARMIGATLDVTESRKIREELLASESRLRNIVDAQTNYVMRIDLQGNYTYFNNKYREDFSWLFDDGVMHGKSPLVTIVSEHYDRVRDASQAAMATPNKVIAVEIDKYLKGGGTRSTYWHFICLTNSNQEPQEIQCIGIDITERKRAENALKASNELYEYVNKATNDAIYDWHSNEDQIYWGESYTRLFGYEINDGKYPLEKWYGNVHDDDRDRIRRSLSEALVDSQVSNWEGEYQFRKADGDYAFVREKGYILRDEKGAVARMIGILRDITKQKQEEHHLKLLESVVTHANDAVLIAAADPLNRSGLSILYANRAFTKMTGYELREVIGKSTSLFNGPESGQQDIHDMIDAVRNGHSIHVETIQYKKSGEQFWISVSLNPIEDHKGNITHWVSIAHEITERMQYIEAIEQQNEKLKNIAWIQSHVVRAPLTRLMGIVDLIKNYPNTDREKDELLDHIQVCAHELDGIIREIADETRVDMLR